MGIFKSALKAVAKKAALVGALFVGKKVLSKVMESKAQQPAKLDQFHDSPLTTNPSVSGQHPWKAH